MRYEYVTLPDELYVSHTEMYPNGQVSVHFEQYNTPEGIRELDILVPSLHIQFCRGFSAKYIDELITYAKNNSNLICHLAKVGGFDAACN